MPLRKILPLIFSFIYAVSCFAQDTVEKKNRINDDVTEVFNVLKDHPEIRVGQYHAFYRRKTPVALGLYTNGKKTGLWRFYDRGGNIIQIYNYNTDSLRYEVREDVTSNLRYLIDREVTPTDKTTKPVKAGGRFYGYLPYLGMYKIPFNPYQYGTYGCEAVIELLVSPLGRLAEFKIRSVCNLLEYDQTVTMDVNLFKEEDRKFIPATFNGEPILSRIVIHCRVTTDGALDFY